MSFLGDASPVLEGATDGTRIGNVSDSLKVYTTGGSPSSFSSKLRYLDMNVSNGGVARGTSITNATWVTVFSYSGSGSLAAFLANLETGNNWRIRLVVDSEEIFGATGMLTNDITSDSIYDLDPSGKSISENQDAFGIFMGSHDVFHWSGPLFIPIAYTSSVSVLVKMETGAASKKFQGGLMILSKET